MPCYICGEKIVKKCASCKVTSYCSVVCQKKDWSRHKLVCLKHTEVNDEIQSIVDGYLNINQDIIANHYSNLDEDVDKINYYVIAALHKFCAINSQLREGETVAHKIALASTSNDCKYELINEKGFGRFQKYKIDDDFFKLSYSINVYNDIHCIKYKNYIQKVYTAMGMYTKLKEGGVVPKGIPIITVKNYLDNRIFHRLNINIICAENCTYNAEKMAYINYIKYICDNL
jgi:hypothetical protein